MGSSERQSEGTVDRSSEHREAMWPASVNAEKRLEPRTSPLGGRAQQAQEEEAYRDTRFPITTFSSHLCQYFKSIKEQRNLLELRSNAVVRLEKTHRHKDARCARARMKEELQ